MLPKFAAQARTFSKGDTLTLKVSPLFKLGLMQKKPRHVRKVASNRENHLIFGKLVFQFVSQCASLRRDRCDFSRFAL